MQPLLVGSKNLNRNKLASSASGAIDWLWVKSFNHCVQMKALTRFANAQIVHHFYLNTQPFGHDLIN